MRQREERQCAGERNRGSAEWCKEVTVLLLPERERREVERERLPAPTPRHREERPQER